MAEQRPNWARLIPDLIVLGLLGASALASLCLWFLGDWDQYGFWLALTIRIIWGCWILACLATVLTKVTIFGWTFRKYFRSQADGPPPPIRPTRAPWVKSAAASFSFTVAMVSVTGVFAIAWAVMFILKGVVGDYAYWLVSMILGTIWWVTMITLVLIRIAVFAAERKKFVEPPPQQEPVAASAPEGKP